MTRADIPDVIGVVIWVLILSGVVMVWDRNR